MVPNDTALSLELRTYDARITDRAGRVARVAAFLVGLLLAWCVFCTAMGRPVRRNAVLLSAVLMGLLVPVASLGVLSWPVVLSRCALGMIAAGVLALLSLGLRRQRTKRMEA